MTHKFKFKNYISGKTKGVQQWTKELKKNCFRKREVREIEGNKFYGRKKVSWWKMELIEKWIKEKDN